MLYSLHRYETGCRGTITHEWFHVGDTKFSHKDPQIAAFKGLPVLQYYNLTQREYIPTIAYLILGNDFKYQVIFGITHRWLMDAE